VDPDARRDLAQMPLLALISLTPRRAEVRALADDGSRPVVFVHGLGGYRSNFLPMRTWFRLVGRSRTYSIGLKGASLEIMAAQLRDYVAEVVTVNKLGIDDPIDLVGHSMGGIVARLALEEPSVARRVATLVTLSSPHGGTQAARFAGSDICRELRPGSRVLRRLESQLPWRGPARLVCFWSRTDPLMQPATTATVEGACNREIAGMSHLDWLLKRRAWQTIWRELEGDRRGPGASVHQRSEAS
jgi:pimeloyl-ACP methyl ester carboxylesterase